MVHIFMVETEYIPLIESKLQGYNFHLPFPWSGNSFDFGSSISKLGSECVI